MFEAVLLYMWCSVFQHKSWGCRRQNKEHALEVKRFHVLCVFKSYWFLFFWINCSDFWNVAMFKNKVVTNWTNLAELYFQKWEIASIYFNCFIYLFFSYAKIHTKKNTWKWHPPPHPKNQITIDLYIAHALQNILWGQ